MKKRMALLLALLLLFLTLSPGIAAAAGSGDWQEAVTAAVRNREERVDLPSGGVKVTELLALLNSFYQEPDFFYFDYGSYRYYESNPNVAVSLDLHYLSYTREQIRAYENAAKAVLVEAVFPGMNDLQKVLALHDWLAIHLQYDQATAAGTSVNRDSFTAYGALVNRKAVCEGYALAYQSLLKRCGIQAVTISSESMNHGWNLVCLGGEWYHVDVTWDDPAPDTLGCSEHTFFLRSDMAMTVVGDDNGELHYRWGGDWSCTDIRYDTAFWLTLDQNLIFTDANTLWYLRTNGSGAAQNISLIRRDWKSGKETTAASVRDLWSVRGKAGYYWLDSYTGLSLRGDWLYFNDSRHIYAYDLYDGGLETVFTYEGNDGDIYGLGPWEYGVRYAVSTGPKEKTEIRTLSLPVTLLSFSDVSKRDYFYKAVRWAYKNGIISGKGDGSFSPMDTCSRAEAVTVFWRVAGCPAPKTSVNPYCDVPEGSWYRDAVLWASETGVLTGTGTDQATGLALFSPGDACSYAHIITMLWRYVTGQQTSSSGPWYSDAMAWAETLGLLSGTGLNSGTAPNGQLCPRKDLAEFLYRYTCG